MILAVLITNTQGNILVERFNGVASEDREQWRSFLTKLGQTNLKGVNHDEHFIAHHKSVYVVYTLSGEVSIFAAGKDEYDELTPSVKDVCGKPPSERRFLNEYGQMCLCLDEILWKGVMENNDRERVKRLTRLKPPTEF